VPAPAPAAATAASPPPRRYSWLEIVLAFTPISIFVIMSKLTTYLSYYYVSVSLSHTAKASEPIFNVLVAAVIFGEFHSAHVYLSLLPIALGITLASVTDFSYNHIGFAWSVASALMKVLQNIYTKKLMLTGRFSFWEIHLFCGAASLAIFAPAVLLQCLSARVNPFARCGGGGARALAQRACLVF
jgi:solute carrier family 35 protein E1